MPGFATEAAWFGKPVIIGGYAKSLWDELLPPEWIPPTHYCRPEELERAIERMATSPEYRIDLGRRARAFVESKWHPRLVAKRYLDVAAGRVPADWFYDPKRNRYWQGCCLSEAGVKSLISAFVEEGGKEALQLADKVELERLLLDVARGEGAR
jgi:hypothetical protein